MISLIQEFGKYEDFLRFFGNGIYFYRLIILGLSRMRDSF